MRERLARLIALATLLLAAGAALLFATQQEQRMGQLAGAVDPAAWKALFPLHYSSFLESANEEADARHDKLAANPFRRRAYAGHAYELAHHRPRAHLFAQIDQRDSPRVRGREATQPAGCITCHAAEAPGLIEKFGWEGLQAKRYEEVAHDVHFGSSCADCHAARTMTLRISRPAFLQAMAARGIDVGAASRQEMRSYVCAQCHVEYHFSRPEGALELPWREGLSLEAIERFHDDAGISDWVHRETSAGLIKIQHPQFELYSRGAHAEAGVACADCHMPRREVSGTMITDHSMRSPLTQAGESCGGCHGAPPEAMVRRTLATQQKTQTLLREVEVALGDLMDAIVAARSQGLRDDQLLAARVAHRQAQLRWDFVDAENSLGFHAPQEARRLLTDAMALARAGEQSIQARRKINQSSE